MESKKYIIQDLFHVRDTTQFINDDTTSLEDIWVTNWPRKKEKNPEDYRPLIFDDKKTAQRYLAEIKRQARVDWSENSHIHKMYGFRKPEWDLYEYTPIAEVITNE